MNKHEIKLLEYYNVCDIDGISSNQALQKKR